MAAAKEVEDFLLDSHVIFGPFDTFPEFQDLFPSKYRAHPDVRLLYQAFKRHRRLVTGKVNKDIVQKYNKTEKDGTHAKVGDQHLEDAVQFLEEKEEEVKGRLQETQADIKSLEKEIKRLTKSVEDNSLADVLPQDFSTESIQKLYDALKKR
ncbi:uncharacterized protein [Amphiura filiformis]|uniref:uncharacterized protein n=1 Tax=Amphiura filiformis TaxID=82378 RepID=UPI003B20CEAA